MGESKKKKNESEEAFNGKLVTDIWDREQEEFEKGRNRIYHCANCGICSQERFAIIDRYTYRSECGITPLNVPIILDGKKCFLVPNAYPFKKRVHVSPTEYFFNTYPSDNGKLKVPYREDCRLCAHRGELLYLKDRKMYALECFNDMLCITDFPKLYFPWEMKMEKRRDKKIFPYSVKDALPRVLPPNTFLGHEPPYLVPAGNDVIPNCCHGFKYDNETYDRYTSRSLNVFMVREREKINAQSNSSEDAKEDWEQVSNTYQITLREFNKKVKYHNEDLPPSVLKRIHDPPKHNLESFLVSFIEGDKKYRDEAISGTNDPDFGSMLFDKKMVQSFQGTDLENQELRYHRIKIYDKESDNSYLKNDRSIEDKLNSIFSTNGSNKVLVKFNRYINLISLTSPSESIEPSLIKDTKDITTLLDIGMYNLIAPSFLGCQSFVDISHNLIKDLEKAKPGDIKNNPYEYKFQNESLKESTPQETIMLQLSEDIKYKNLFCNPSKFSELMKNGKGLISAKFPDEEEQATLPFTFRTMMLKNLCRVEPNIPVNLMDSLSRQMMEEAEKSGDDLWFWKYYYYLIRSISKERLISDYLCSVDNIPDEDKIQDYFKILHKYDKKDILASPLVQNFFLNPYEFNSQYTKLTNRKSQLWFSKYSQENIEKKEQKKKENIEYINRVKHYIQILLDEYEADNVEVDNVEYEQEFNKKCPNNRAIWRGKETKKFREFKKKYSDFKGFNPNHALDTYEMQEGWDASIYRRGYSILTFLIGGQLKIIREYIKNGMLDLSKLSKRDLFHLLFELNYIFMVYSSEPAKPNLKFVESTIHRKLLPLLWNVEEYKKLKVPSEENLRLKYKIRYKDYQKIHDEFAPSCPNLDQKEWLKHIFSKIDLVDSILGKDKKAHSHYLNLLRISRDINDWTQGVEGKEKQEVYDYIGVNSQMLFNSFEKPLIHLRFLFRTHGFPVPTSDHYILPDKTFVEGGKLSEDMIPSIGPNLETAFGNYGSKGRVMPFIPPRFFKGIHPLFKNPPHKDPNVAREEYKEKNHQPGQKNYYIAQRYAKKILSEKVYNRGISFGIQRSFTLAKDANVGQYAWGCPINNVVRKEKNMYPFSDSIINFADKPSKDKFPQFDQKSLDRAVEISKSIREDKIKMGKAIGKLLAMPENIPSLSTFIFSKFIDSSLYEQVLQDASDLKNTWTWAMVRQFVKQLRNQMGKIELDSNSPLLVSGSGKDSPHMRLNAGIDENCRLIYSKWGSNRLKRIWLEIKNEILNNIPDKKRSSCEDLLERIQGSHTIIGLWLLSRDYDSSDNDKKTLLKQFALILGVDDEKVTEKKADIDSNPTLEDKEKEKKVAEIPDESLLEELLVDYMAKIDDFAKIEDLAKVEEIPSDSENKEKIKSAQEYMEQLKNITPSNIKKNMGIMKDEVESGKLHEKSAYKQYLIKDLQYVLDHINSKENSKYLDEINDFLGFISSFPCVLTTNYLNSLSQYISRVINREHFRKIMKQGRKKSAKKGDIIRMPPIRKKWFVIVRDLVIRCLNEEYKIQENIAQICNQASQTIPINNTLRPYPFFLSPGKDEDFEVGILVPNANSSDPKKPDYDFRPMENFRILSNILREKWGMGNKKKNVLKSAEIAIRIKSEPYGIGEDDKSTQDDELKRTYPFRNEVWNPFNKDLQDFARRFFSPLKQYDFTQPTSEKKVQSFRQNNGPKEIEDKIQNDPSNEVKSLVEIMKREVPVKLRYIQSFNFKTNKASKVLKFRKNINENAFNELYKYLGEIKKGYQAHEVVDEEKIHKKYEKIAKLLEKFTNDTWTSKKRIAHLAYDERRRRYLKRMGGSVTESKEPSLHFGNINEPDINVRLRKKRKEQETILENTINGDWMEFLQYLHGNKYQITDQPYREFDELPVFTIRISKNIKKKIIGGMDIQALQIHPPQLPSLNVHHNVALSQSSVEVNTEKKEIKFNWKPKKITGKRIMGMDINRLNCNRPISVQIISVEGAKGYLENIQKGGDLQIPPPGAFEIEQYDLSTNKDNLIKDICFLLEMSSKPLNSLPDPSDHSSKILHFAKFWEKIEKSVLPRLGRSRRDYPYVSDGSFVHITKDYENLDGSLTSFSGDKTLFGENVSANQLTFQDYLYAPAIYWETKRIHIQDHIRLLQRAIRTLSRKARASGKTIFKLRRIKIQHKQLNTRYEYIRDTLINYLIRVIAYLVAVLEPNILVHENLSVKAQGERGFLNSIISGMIKGFPDIKKKMIDLLNSWGKSKIVGDLEYSGVASYYTSSYHFECYSLFRLFKLACSKVVGNIKEKNQLTKEQKLEALKYKLIFQSGHAHVDRDPTADWGICYFHMALWKEEGKPMEEGSSTDNPPPHIFNGHDNAALNVAFRGALKEFKEIIF